MRRLLSILIIIAASVTAFAQNSVYYWFDQQTNRNVLNGNEISTVGLSTGIHFAHFQIKGGDGLLSPVRTQAFLVVNETIEHSPEYSAVNYWFDQQTVKTAYTGGDINVSALSNGLHTVHFQILDSGNKPCPVQSQFFLKLDFAVHKLYYWFDTDSNYPRFADINSTEIDVDGLANGKHTLHVMLADANGHVISNEEMVTEFFFLCPYGRHTDRGDGICRDCEEPLSYTRATTAGRYGTICLPKGAEAGNISGATFYSIAGKRVDGEGLPTSIVLEEVSNIEAGKPYVFLGSGSELKVTYSGQAVAEASSENGLVGSFTGQDVAEGMYLLSNNQIIKCGTGCSIGANRAFINMTDVPEYVEGAVSPSKIAIIGLEGTTAINSITIEGDAIRYNLSGIRIPAGTKGITIINGKKVLNK